METYLDQHWCLLTGSIRKRLHTVSILTANDILRECFSTNVVCCFAPFRVSKKVVVSILPRMRKRNNSLRLSSSPQQQQDHDINHNIESKQGIVISCYKFLCYKFLCFMVSSESLSSLSSVCVCVCMYKMFSELFISCESCE